MPLLTEDLERLGRADLWALMAGEEDSRLVDVVVECLRAGAMLLELRVAPRLPIQESIERSAIRAAERRLKDHAILARGLLRERAVAAFAHMDLPDGFPSSVDPGHPDFGLRNQMVWYLIRALLSKEEEPGRSCTFYTAVHAMCALADLEEERRARLEGRVHLARD